MQTLQVDLGVRTYPIYIGENLLCQADLYSKHIPSNDVVIITNETVAPLYLDQISAALKNKNIRAITLPDGESHKNLTTMESIFTELLTNRCARDTTIVALGGGVIGDISGFAAACYQRGINFIQVPTTLLSQVDSSVGGKTGVNHALGKNMIGAFYQPKCVVADIGTLHTLPKRELSAGIAEVIKYGILGDLEFFQWLEANVKKLVDLNTDTLMYAIERSCQCKADIVASDEHEKSGRRALLNLGHTFGHAIETGMGYGKWLHGEAVGCGMVVAAEFSERMGLISKADVNRISSLISQANLPTKLPAELSADQMIELMAIDKKVKDGKLHLILINNIGNAVLTSNCEHELLIETLAELTQAA